MGIFFLVIGYFFTAQMSCIATDDAKVEEAGEGKGDDGVVSAKKMGIEIETSAIKIDSGGDHKIGFTIQTPAGKNWIILEEDTSDSTFEGAADLERFDKNLECKTVNGLYKEDMLAASFLIHPK